MDSIEEGADIDRPWFERAGGLEHRQAGERGAGAVADGHRWRRARADAAEEGLELGGVAFLGPPLRPAAPAGGLHREALEVLDADGEAGAKGLHALAAAARAAERAVGQVAHRAV